LINELLDRFGRSPVSFDAMAAEEFAVVVAARRKQGRPIEPFNAQIAAIAVSHGLALATLNVSDFAGIDRLTVIDPSA
jgi:toxin FitB